MFDWSEKETQEFYNSNIERISTSLNLVRDVKEYIDKVNKTKRIKKYFKLINEDNITKFSSVIIDYLDQFRPDFIEYLEYRIY